MSRNQKNCSNEKTENSYYNLGDVRAIPNGSFVIMTFAERNYMKKIIEKISWIMAVTGVFAIVLETSIVNNYILFYIGIGMLIIGIVGVLLTGEKTKEIIWELLDFL